MTLAQKYFGDMYAGFDILLRDLGRRIGVDMVSHRAIKLHKWRVLSAVIESKDVEPKEAAEIITEITDITFDPKMLDEFQASWEAKLN